MTKTSWHFENTLFPSLYISKPDESQLEKANRLFAKKEFARSFRTMLQAFDPGIGKTYGNKKQDQFRIPHLYTTVDIILGSKEWTIKALLPALLPVKKAARLGQLLEEGFLILNLPAVYLDGDQPFIQYTCKPSDGQPEILSGVLHEMGMFIHQYHLQFDHIPVAEHIRNMPAFSTPAPQPASTWKTILQYIDEGLSGETKVIDSISWYIVINSLYKITHYCAPVGETGRLLARAQKEMVSLDGAKEQIEAGQEALRAIKKRGSSELLQDLPPFTVVLPSKETSALFHMQPEFYEFYELLGEMLQAREYDNIVQVATLRLLGIMDTNCIPASIYNFLNNALLAASQKSWPEAAAILYNTVDQLCNRLNVALLAGDL